MLASIIGVQTFRATLAMRQWTQGGASMSGCSANRWETELVIPTVLLPTAVVGRWWVVPIAAVAWASILLVDGLCDLGCAAGAAGVAAVNAVVGVLVHKAALWLFRHRPRGLGGTS
jgi:hypothetical protein